ncbi:UTP6 [Mytilus coruscus]|uniref:UTP6 n=1 Tax=Mytilus coruscus TaxID=42192 RepID=A0A6J8DL08_MYTCO|nr:UTP6 [Mytilus coruscus]
MDETGNRVREYEHDSNNKPLFSLPRRIVTSTSNGNIWVVDLYDKSFRGRVVVLGQAGNIVQIYTGHPDVNFQTNDEGMMFPYSLALSGPAQFYIGCATPEYSPPSAKAKLFKESLEVWRLLLDFCVTCQSEKTEELFEKGICSCRQVALPLKEYYLQWMYLTKGVQKARTLFQRLIQTKPVSLQLFYEYMKIENAQASSKIKLLRRAYEDATMEFGNSSADLWLDFIKMEMNHPKGQPENVGTLHYRAINQLDGELNQQFVTEFTLLQTGHDIDTF